MEIVSSAISHHRIYTKRSRITIIADILTKTKTSLRKTQIIYRCNLTHKQLEPYLRLLLETNLLVRKADNTGREKFETTVKGKKFVREFKALQALM